METNFSEIENYPFLSPFLYIENPSEIEKKKKSILILLNNDCPSKKTKKITPLEYLNSREKVFSKVISKYYQKNYQKIIKNDLTNKNSFDTLSKNTLLLDSIIHTAFEYAFQDISIVKEKFYEELKKEHQTNKQSLPENKKKLYLTRK